MLQELPRIRTPWKQQWRRIRYQMFPVLVMGVSLFLTGYLWNRHAGLMTGLGEVDTSQRVVLCPIDGALLPLNGDQSHPRLYDRVEQGQLIARLDDASAKRSLDLMTLDLKRLQLELEGRKAALQAEEETRREDRFTEERRLANKVDGLKLQLLEYRSKLELDKIELHRLEGMVAALKQAGGQQVAENQHQRDVVAQRIKSNEAALAECDAQLKAALRRTEAHARSPEAEAIEKQLAPLRAAIALQEKKLEEVQAQIKAMEIISPFRGRIVSIHSWPGQLVRVGEPLVTIAREQGSHIRCYVRQEQRMNPTLGMQVEIRRRLPGTKSVLTYIESVGPQLEQVPAHLLRDPKALEWGIPVNIAMPAQVDLRPGELVDLKFFPDKKQG